MNNMNTMTNQTTFLLRTMWENPSWRDAVFAVFKGWVENGASRRDVQDKLPALIEADFAEQPEMERLMLDLEQVNWEQLTEFLCMCFYRKHLRHAFPVVPSDEQWMELSDEQFWAPLSHHPQQDVAIENTVPVPLFPLEQRLLVYGGVRMVYRFESDCKLLLERGEVFDGSVELIRGKPSDCHANAAHLWSKNMKGRSKNKGMLSIMTGYGLSDDGLWRQHSWLVKRSSEVARSHLIETTIIRVKYYGYILTDVEAEAFVRVNAG